MIKKSIHIFILCFSIYYIGCNKETDDPNSQDNDLTESTITDITWTLFKYSDISGTHFIIPEQGENYTIIFNSSGDITAKDACNDCSALFELVNEDEINITDMSCTEIACSGGQYIVNFYEKTSFQFLGDTLTLSSTNDLIQLNPTSFYLIKDQ